MSCRPSVFRFDGPRALPAARLTADLLRVASAGRGLQDLLRRIADDPEPLLAMSDDPDDRVALVQARGRLDAARQLMDEAEALLRARAYPARLEAAEK